MSNLKKVNKILFITLLVFSVGVFANYSRTSSKYYVQDTDTNDSNIVNLISFKSLKFGETLGLIGYEEKLTDLLVSDIQYTLNYYRKIVSTTDTDVVTDKYRIVVEPGCEIKEIKTPGAPKYVPKDDGSINPDSKGAEWYAEQGEGSTTNNQAVLTYTNDVNSNTSRDDMIAVIYSCPLEIVKRPKTGDTSAEETYTKPSVYEQIDDESEFLYLTGDLKRDFKQKEYKVKIDGARNQRMHIPVNDEYINLDDEFNKWIKVYATGIMNDYVQFTALENQIKVYMADKDVRKNPNKGMGLKSGNSDAGSDYKLMYEFDTMASQALTYATNVKGSSKPTYPWLYFIEPMDVATADALFESYLKTYYSKYSEAERNTIINYVKSEGGISSILGNSKKEIAGISHIAAGSRDYVYIGNDIFKQIEYTTGVVVAKGTTNIYSAFSNAINSKNSKYNWFDASDLEAALYVVRSSRNYIAASLNTTNANLNDYYFIRAGSYLVSIRIHNRSDDPDNTYAEFYRFKIDINNPNTAVETLVIDNPTRLMFIDNIKAAEKTAGVISIEDDRGYINYLSEVIAIKTGVAPVTYKDVVDDAKAWYTSSPRVDGSAVVDFVYANGLVAIDYNTNPKIVPITRTTYTAPASTQTADAESSTQSSITTQADLNSTTTKALDVE